MHNIGTGITISDSVVIPPKGGGSSDVLVVYTTINKDAENGTINGWVSDYMVATNSPGHTGAYHFTIGVGEATFGTIMGAYQRIDLGPSGINLPASAIDAGRITASMNFWLNAGFLDLASGGLVARNAGLTSIGSDMSVPVSDTGAWLYKEQSLLLPSGTRYVDIYLQGENQYANDTRTYFDDISDVTFTS